MLGVRGKLPKPEEEVRTPLQVRLPEDRGSLMNERPRVQPSFVALCGVRATVGLPHSLTYSDESLHEGAG